MLIREVTLRKLIQETLLLEVKKLNELKENPELFELFNEQFVLIHAQYDLNNQKSPGRYFSEILYACMKQLNSREYFSTDGRPLNISILKSLIYNICDQLVFLFKKKEISSKTVNHVNSSGKPSTFKEFVNEFNQKFMSPVFEGNNILEKIDFVCNQMSENISFSTPDNIISNLKKIKENETKYPFGENTIVDGKYKVVCPQTIISSIFWARSNADGKQIVLPNKDSVNWCTGRYTGNFFNTYFIGHGANLYYFLPIDDEQGIEKFCIGFFKEVDEQTNKEVMYTNGTMNVNFQNHSFLKDQKPEMTRSNIQKLSVAANISIETINELIDNMSNKSPSDLFKVISLTDLEQFKSITNLNSIAPRLRNGQRDPDNLQVIFGQIARLLKTYVNPKYTDSKYLINEDIVNYCVKMWPIWINEGIKNLNEDGHILNLFKLVPGLSADADFVKGFIAVTPSCYSYLDPSLKDNPEFVEYLIDHAKTTNVIFSPAIGKNYDLMLKAFKKNPYRTVEDISPDLIKNDNFIKELLTIDPNMFDTKTFNKSFILSRRLILQLVKSNPRILQYEQVKQYTNDFEICLEALVKDKELITVVSNELKNNPVFCKELYNRRPDYFNFDIDISDLSKYQKEKLMIFKKMYNRMNQQPGFFNNITNKVKSFFKENNTYDGRIIRISENELRKIIRREILK